MGTVWPLNEGIKTPVGKSVKNVISVIARTWNFLSGTCRFGCVALIFGQVGYMFTPFMQPAGQICSVFAPLPENVIISGPLTR